MGKSGYVQDRGNIEQEGTFAPSGRTRRCHLCGKRYDYDDLSQVYICDECNEIEPSEIDSLRAEKARLEAENAKMREAINKSVKLLQQAYDYDIPADYNLSILEWLKDALSPSNDESEE